MSRVLCVWNFYATFIATFCKFVATFDTFVASFFATFRATFLQLLATIFFATKSCKKLQNKLLRKSCLKKLQFFGAKKLGGEVAKKLHKSYNKVAKSCKKSCIKVANTEPGTQ